MLRTNTCGELAKAHVGRKVVLCGWVQARRDHGGVLFIDLRDSYGIIQVVCDPSHSKAVHGVAEKAGREFVLRASGKVRSRPEGMVNPNLATGEIEVLADDVSILNSSDLPPIEVEDRTVAGDELRLKYRYIDLRRPVMQHNLRLRHSAAQAVRQFLNGHGFTEVETPLLIKHTPEGARDYVVPSRIHPGKFYSLPQSPQLYKQLLVMSGIDRYYQLARCLRDEDLRQDRQPEFTQIDIEMAFIEEEDIYGLVEGLLSELWKKIRGIEVHTPFPRLTYREAVDRFGSDKPDTRFGFELVDVTDVVGDSVFSVFLDVIKRGGIVKCINAVGCADFSRKDIDELTQFVSGYGAKGLAWMKVDDGLESSIVQYFSPVVQKRLVEASAAKKGDLLLFVADREKVVSAALGSLRVEIARRLGKIDESAFRFLWVTDFPLLEFDEDEQRYVAMHHPFTAPRESDVHFLASDKGKLRARAYDITLNGVEIGGGSIRNSRPDIQSRVFEALGITEKEASDKFGFLLDALRHGAPPHGGIALGFDRIVALLCGTHDIREVIAFPKNKKAENPMDGCPSPVDERQLKELHISGRKE